MNNATVVFEPYAAADLRNIVQTIVVYHKVAITVQIECIRSLSFSGPRMAKYWAVFSEIFGRVGCTQELLAGAAPVRGHGFGRESMKPAELCAVERGCTDASSTPSVFKRDLFYEKLGYRVLGRFENHPIGHQRRASFKLNR
jgi:hypothetical protein